MTGEEGAMVVLFAILLSALLLAATMVLDTGQLVGQRFRLQNGADAAALAIGMSCAVTDGCQSEVDAIADRYVGENAAGATSHIAELLSETPGHVRVEARIGSIPLMTDGVGDLSVAALARAAWGPIGAATTAPLGIADCGWHEQPGREVTIAVRPFPPLPEPTPLCGNQGVGVGGHGAGAAMLTDCDTASSVLDSDVHVQQGAATLATTMAKCEIDVGDRALVTIICPHADDDCPTHGIAGESYLVAGYGFFVITKVTASASGSCQSLPGLSVECLSGYFERGVVPDGRIGGEDFGARTVRLTN